MWPLPLFNWDETTKFALYYKILSLYCLLPCEEKGESGRTMMKDKYTLKTLYAIAAGTNIPFAHW